MYRPRPRRSPTDAPAAATIAIAIAIAIAVAVIAAGCSLGSGQSGSASGSGPSAGDGDSSSVTSTDQVDVAAGTASTLKADGSEPSAAESGSTSESASPSGSEQAPITPTDSYCDGQAPTDIDFAPGGSSATIDGTASADRPDRYRIVVGDDQIIVVSIDSADTTVAVTLLAPDATGASDPFTGRTEVPTTAGAYQICVTTDASGPVGHRLSVSVIDDNTPTRVDAPWCGDTVNDRGEIRFDRGRSSGTVEAGLIRTERDLYTLDAEAGQDIDLLLGSLEANAVFDLRSPSGEVLQSEVADARLPLPETGTYQICIGSLRGNASYVLDVAIT